MKVKKTLCDVCGIELPEMDSVYRHSTRIKAKIKKIKDETRTYDSRVVKLDLCEQCLYNLCTNYNIRKENEK